MEKKKKGMHPPLLTFPGRTGKKRGRKKTSFSHFIIFYFATGPTIPSFFKEGKKKKKSSLQLLRRPGEGKRGKKGSLLPLSLLSAHAQERIETCSLAFTSPPLWFKRDLEEKGEEKEKSSSSSISLAKAPRQKGRKKGWASSSIYTFL